MIPTVKLQRTRIGMCLDDLSHNGIDLMEADDRRIRQVVREYLEYFQLMLGYDSDAAEVLELIKARRAGESHC